MTPWISLILLLPACAETLIPEAEPLSQDSLDESLNTAVPGPTVDNPPPTEASFKLTDGQAVQISGQVTYTGDANGSVLLQFLKEKEGQPAELLHSEKLQAPGPFLVKAPSDLGLVSAVAILDRDQDGFPTVDDLGGRFDMTVGSQSIDAVQIEIGDIATLGSLTPGQLLPGTGTIDGPMQQLEDHPATVPPPPAEEPGPPKEPQAPNIPRSLDTPTLGNTANTDHPPVGGVEPPPDSIHATPRNDGEAE